MARDTHTISSFFYGMSMAGTFEQADNFVIMAYIGELICGIADTDLQYKLMKAVL